MTWLPEDRDGPRPLRYPGQVLGHERHPTWAGAAALRVPRDADAGAPRPRSPPAPSKPPRTAPHIDRLTPAGHRTSYGPGLRRGAVWIRSQPLVGADSRPQPQMLRRPQTMTHPARAGSTHPTAKHLTTT